VKKKTQKIPRRNRSVGIIGLTQAELIKIYMQAGVNRNWSNTRTYTARPLMIWTMYLV